MAIKQVDIFKLSELTTTGTKASAVNVTRARLNTKQIVGTLQLTAKGVGTSASLDMCCDNSGNIYIADYTDHVILKLQEGGKINHLAGSAGVSGNNSALQNVTGTAARFNGPSGIACDKSGNIYIADRGNNQIRMIRDGKVGVLAGNGATTAGLVDATSNPLQAQFNNPVAVAVDNSGVVYVADIATGAIRKIWGGRVLTICGGASGDLQNRKASKIAGANGFFANINSICVDANGNIFASDSSNNNIKKITPNGWVYLFSGSGVSGHALGTGARPAYTCTYADPLVVRCDRVGNVYVLDAQAQNNRLIKLNQFGVPSNIVEFNEAGTDVYSSVKGMCVSPSGNVFVALVHA